MDDVLSREKANLHKKFLRFPVETLTLSNEIKSDFDNVFDGQDPIIEYRFRDDDYLRDWEAYQVEYLRERERLRTEGLDNMMGRVNSLIVIDAPAEQTTEKPEPYFYFQHIGNVVDYKENMKNELDWVVTKEAVIEVGKEPEYYITVFDDASYRRYRMTDGSFTEIKALVSESGHTFGYCPVNWFWRVSMTADEPDIKRSPISDFISMYDKLLLKQKSKDVLDHTASNPIIWFFQGDCDYEHPETKAVCRDGYLRNPNNEYIVSRLNRDLTPCPKCHESRFPGAGSYIGVPAPEEGSTVNMREPAGIISVDRDGLDYTREEVDNLRQAIYQGVTGNIFEVIDKQAINEEQVRSFFEARKKVYFSIKRNFEYIQEWIDKTICKMRYGDAFIDLTINYGTEFFLFSAEEALDIYKAARDAKLDPAILDMLNDQYTITAYRHNKELMERAKIINNLDPFRHLTRDEVQNMYQQNLVEYKDYMLKANFSSLVARFERENIKIHLFGLALPFSKRIDAIKKALMGYIIQPPPKPIEQPDNPGKSGKVAQIQA